jgi:hypothetical protein
MLRIFCIELEEKYEGVYEQLLVQNPEWLIWNKIVTLGFETLIDMKNKKMI